MAIDKKLIAAVSNPVFIYSVLAVIILITINSLFNKAKGNTTDEQKEFREESDGAKLNELQLFNEFKRTDLLNPNYWKYSGANETVLISTIEARRLARNLDKALWQNALWTWDDVPAVYGVFDSLLYQVNVSQIADEFLLETGESLRGRLLHNLKALEISHLMRIINEKL